MLLYWEQSTVLRSRRLKIHVGTDEKINKIKETKKTVTPNQYSVSHLYMTWLMEYNWRWLFHQFSCRKKKSIMKLCWCENTDWKSLILTTPVDTHPAEWHDVESVATTIDFIKEVTVGEMRCIVYLQLTARIPAGTEEIIFKSFYNRTTQLDMVQHINLPIYLITSNSHLLWTGLPKGYLLKLIFPLLNVSWPNDLKLEKEKL